MRDRGDDQLPPNIQELGGSNLRVGTLSDGKMIHNVFPDRSFFPQEIGQEAQ